MRGIFIEKFLTEIKFEEEIKLLTYKEIKEDKISSYQIVHSVSNVRSFNDDKPAIVHINKFYGYSFQHLNGNNEKLLLEVNPDESDMIIIDDADNGIRSDENIWIEQLSENKKNFHILHKIYWPLTGNHLLTKLTDKYSDKMIVICNADDLREHGLKISKQLSWDKTIEDFHDEFHANPKFASLRKCGILIVRFGLEATLTIVKKLSAPDGKKKEESTFYYFPSKYEGQIFEEAKKYMQGMTIAFIAAMVKELLNYKESDQPALKNTDVAKDQFQPFTEYLSKAIVSGMKAAINCFEKGYVKDKETIELDYPANEIFKDNDSKIQMFEISRFLSDKSPKSLMVNSAFSGKDLINYLSYFYVIEKVFFYLICFLMLNLDI